MLPELSLNILDIAENSVKARASRVEVSVLRDTREHLLTIRVKDNGCGMDEEQVQRVTDPFFTSRKTRKVGLGVPFLKQAAEITGGSFTIDSEVGAGTTVEAVFREDSIDCMPLGNVCDSVFSLILMNEGLRWIYTYEADGEGFTLDTDELRAELGDDVSLQEPEVSAFIREFLTENTKETDLRAGLRTE